MDEKLNEAKPKPKPTAAARVEAIDVLRGFVMVLMAIDHASEAMNRGRLFTDSAWFFKPGTPLPEAQFFTRWMTHLCAPTFVTLAGTALAISTESRRARGDSEGKITKHIFIRGALILAFEVIWMSPAMMESFGRILFQVLYAIGASLMCMSILRRLSDRALTLVGVGLALLSELIIDRLAAADIARTIPSAAIISGGFFFNWKFVIAYPLIPWLSMMCLGWAFGRHYVEWRKKDETHKAPRFLFLVSAIFLGTFGLLRALNGYGNMHLLKESGDLVQWLHVSKYPPSITYIGLELGIASFVLALLWKLKTIPTILEPFKLLGQTALFFYLLHIHLIALVAHLTGWHHSLGIKSAYIGGVVVVLALLGPCAWYRRYKRAHPNSLAQWI